MSMKRNVVLSAACAFALGSTVASAQQASSASGSDELEEVVVYGSQITLPPVFAGGQVATGGRAGILGNLDSLDTPFSTTSYTSELMLNQQAKSIGDVLLNDPNVRIARGFGNFQDIYMIRGFPTYSDDMTFNGIYGILPRQFPSPEVIERVEVFRGANAFLNGAAPGGSNLGGTINLVPKRAPDEALTRLAAGYEGDATGWVSADVGRRFGAEKDTGIRANLAYRDGETAVDDLERQLSVIGFGVDHQGDKLRLSADVGYQDHHIDAPRPSVTPFGGIPKAPDADVNFGQDWTYTDEEQLFGVVRAEFDITRSVSVWGAFGMRHGEEKNVLANPNSSPDGSLTAYRFDNAREDDVYSGEVGLRWDFATGPIEHRVIVSGSLFNIDSKNAYAFSDFFSPFATNLYHPVNVSAPDADFFTGGSLNNPNTTFETETSSYAIADTLKFADGKVSLTLGARDQTMKNDNFDYNSGDKTSGYDVSKTTPVAGLVVRPMQTLSIFANYIEGLVAGDTAPFFGPAFESVINAGEIQDPYATKQIEAGVKWETDTLGVTAAVFSATKKVGTLTDEFDDPETEATELFFRLSGEQRNRGIEASVFGEPLDVLRIIGGVTWLDSEYTKGGIGLPKGKNPIGTPEIQANFNVEWDLPIEGLTIDGRVVYTSSQYADTANTLEIDSYTRLDIGARYAMTLVGKPFTIRGRIENVTNENDWISAGGYPFQGYIVLGQPLTVLLSASIDF